MSDTLDTSKEVLQKGRQLKLEDDADQGLKVVASLRDQIPAKLERRLDELKIGPKTTELWHLGNSDRVRWLQRQSEWQDQVDQFIDPIYASATDWGSTLHFPTILTACKAYHARMYAALTAIDPPFTVSGRKESFEDRAKLVEDIMRYALNDWCNEYSGYKDSVDKWLWNWVMSGVGIMKVRWAEKFTRFVDVEDQPKTVINYQQDPETGEIIDVPTQVMEEKEVVRTINCFSGPMLEHISVEDLLIIGGDGDPEKADHVIQQQFLTASELLTLADRKIFNAEKVKKIIEGGEDMIASDETGILKQDRSENAGESGPDKSFDTPRYRILEAYLRADVDGSGIESEIIVWVHDASSKILRATYLYRTMPTGIKPYAKIDFHKREGATYGVGLVELLWSVAKEIDVIHNIRIDVGIMTSLPFGFYRPAASTMAEEKFAIEPGTFVPLDNPQTDVYFPQLGNRTSFGFQEEQALQNQIDRLTSLSELSFGLQSAQGAARTATGARALLGESNANLDIYLQRMNRGWKHCLKYLFYLLQSNIKPGFEFRLLGDDGQKYFRKVQDKYELKGLYDFELEPNSANSNKAIRLERAQQIYQLTGNPIDLQLGIVTPQERYESLKTLLLEMGVKSFSKYIRKPAQGSRDLSPLEIANRILDGMDVVLDPTMDLQGFIALVQEIVNSDELLGQFGQYEAAALVSKQQEAQALLEAIEQAQANAAAIQQQALNSQPANAPQQLPQGAPAPGVEQ